MEEKSTYREKTRKPLPVTLLGGCPVNYYRCEKCPNDDVFGCCPIGSSCMCRDDRVDACESFGWRLW